MSLRAACRFLAPLLALSICVACSAQQATTAAPSPTATPAPVAETPPTAGPSQPDQSCKLASDCEVKDVGNCCGYFPACVSKGAKVDPAAVRAECERTGMSAVCGFQEIQACECTQGQCRAASGNPLELDR